GGIEGDRDFLARRKGADVEADLRRCFRSPKRERHHRRHPLGNRNRFHGLGFLSVGYGEVAQLPNPLVAEMSRTRLPVPSATLFGFSPPTYCSTPGLAVAAIPLTLKVSTVVLVPCLRSPIPLVPPLAPVVLFLISTQTCEFSPAVLLPESTRMP